MDLNIVGVLLLAAALIVIVGRTMPDERMPVKEDSAWTLREISSFAVSFGPRDPVI